MDFLLGFFSIVGFCTTAFFIARAFKPASVPEFLLVGFTSLASVIIISGYALSSFDQLAVVAWWAALSALWLTLSIVVSGLLKGKGKTDIGSLLRGSGRRLLLWYGSLSTFEKGLLFPPMVTLVFLGCVNLLLVVFVAPHNWDSIAYHLPRMAYYLQHGNLRYFEADYWAQVVHPKNSTVLFLYTYLVSGRNENLVQFVQYLSYWVSIVSVYAISRRVGGNVTASIFSASVFGLFIEALMEAVTTQNDFLWTVFLAISLYALISYRTHPNRKYLFLTAVGISLALGVKASSILAIPALVIVGVFAVVGKQPQHALRDVGVLIMALVVGLSLLTLPSGYYDNFARFGNAVGPTDVVDEHSFAGTSSVQAIQEGVKNVVRYSMDFLSLDGLPPSGITREAQRVIRILPRELIISMHVETDKSKVYPATFDPDRLPSAHEDMSSLGILGFALMWIAVVRTLFFKTSPLFRVLALATLAYFFAQCFSGPYQAWRGRYFLFAGVLGAPTIVDMIRGVSAGFWRACLIAVTVAGCLCAFSAVVLRPVNDPRGYTRSQDAFSLFGRDRLSQLTTNIHKYYKPISQFEEEVPKDAVVAVCLPQSGFEYPLFGDKLTRTLIPINSFVHGVQPIPKEASFLVFSSEVMRPMREDEFLGEAYYLRKLR